MTAPQMANAVITAGSIRMPALVVVVAAAEADVVVVVTGVELKPPPVADVVVVVETTVVEVDVLPAATVALDAELDAEVELATLGRVENEVIVATGRERLSLAQVASNSVKDVSTTKRSRHGDVETEQGSLK